MGLSLRAEENHDHEKLTESLTDYSPKRNKGWSRRGRSIGFF